MTKKSNQKGFSTVEGLLILLIVVIVAGVGYYVWHSQNKASTTLSKAAPNSGSATTDPYLGWNTVKLPTAKVSLRYPTSWKAATVLSTTSGDSVGLTGSKGYVLDVTYNTGGQSSASGSVLYSKSVSFSGQKDFLDYVGSSAVESVELAQSKTDATAIPKVGTFTVDINGHYLDGSTKTLAQAKADVNFRDTALVVESVKTVK